MAIPFSRRNKPKPDALSYKILKTTRNRLLYSLAQVVRNSGGTLEGMMEYAGEQALIAYGDLRIRSSTLSTAAERHFYLCSDEEVLDFLEWVFQPRYYTARQAGVDAVNTVFREDGIGYEFSPYIANEVPIPGTHGGYGIEIQYPKPIKKGDEVVHPSTAAPALKLLGENPIWKAANDEMLQANDHFRKGHFADAIHWAGKSLESVLQIICAKRKWKFTPDHSTLGPLLKACQDGGLFDSPYIDVIQKSSGEIRNKYSGHGKAMSKHGHATEKMAEHMIQITSAHVLFLAKSAGI
jgi:hypothetical protein